MRHSGRFVQKGCEMTQVTLLDINGMFVKTAIIPDFDDMVPVIVDTLTNSVYLYLDDNVYKEAVTHILEEGNHA